ncbi:MAG: PEP-CTERM sorting domain-containing protein [Planctomycetes bacterium]|nr:PEP-CTERM sorting domain-containing protein [Planctomycetota bacterium]
MNIMILRKINWITFQLRMPVLCVCCLTGLLAPAGENSAAANTLRYILEGDYGDDLATSAVVRGGNFRVSADFDDGDLYADEVDSTSYRNDSVRIETFNTAEDRDFILGVGAFLTAYEVITPFNDRLSVFIPVLLDIIPGSGGIPGVGGTPVIITAGFNIEFFDESIVAGDPISLPLFNDANSGFFMNIRPSLNDNVDPSTLTFRVVEVVPEPPGLALLGVGMIGFLYAANRRRQGLRHWGRPESAGINRIKLLG